jgi:gamma-glutamylcyclotransferase (GGCT)/AIG2-like uncharacterized protein YtfP
MSQMRVFVYGTLQLGYGNNRLLLGAELLGKATTVERYGMFDVGFPFITQEVEETMKGVVTGELWEININSHLGRLDQLEGEGRLYNRVTGLIKLVATGEVHYASYYEIHPYAGHRMRDYATPITPCKNLGTISWR